MIIKEGDLTVGKRSGDLDELDDLWAAVKKKMR